MKKLLLALMLCFVCNCISAQYSVGEYVQVVKGLAGWYQSKLALAVKNIDDKQIPSMVLCSHNSLDYDMFDADSRILIKFDDDSKITLQRVPGDETGKEYHNEVLNGILYNHYYTYTSYLVEQDFLTAILQHNITKIRIVMSNGDIRDYDIKSNYQQTFTQKLKESYTSARKTNKVRCTNMNDDNF